MYVALRRPFSTTFANVYGQVMDNEPENEITVTVFRLLVLDLLALFQALNQAMINILGKIFIQLCLILPFRLTRPRSLL